MVVAVAGYAGAHLVSMSDFCVKLRVWAEAHTMTYNDRREHHDTRFHAWLACLQLELTVAAPSDASASPQSSGENLSQDFCRVTVVG